MRISDRDLKVISFQLERTPKNILKVVLRCSYGYPMVIKSKPVLDGKPFPTLYWLTCPFLRYKLSQLEADGYIPKYEKILSNSSEMRVEEIAAHFKAREEALKLVEEEWIKESLKRRGMGGISNFSHIKCLHLHVAYHLGGIRNPVARMALDEIGSAECLDKWCEKYEEVM